MAAADPGDKPSGARESFAPSPAARTAQLESRLRSLASVGFGVQRRALLAGVCGVACASIVASARRLLNPAPKRRAKRGEATPVAELVLRPPFELLGVDELRDVLRSARVSTLQVCRRVYPRLWQQYM